MSSAYSQSPYGQGYRFSYNKKPEDYIDRNIDSYLSDMVDKYYGDKNKEKEYNEAMKRIKSHRKEDPFTSAEYIEFYPERESDLRFTQLEEFEQKSAKLAMYRNGDTSVYATEAERKYDEEYIKTNNFAYNRKLNTTKSLTTLGKYGEKVNYLQVRGNNNILKSAVNLTLNGFLAVRNATAVVYRAIGKPVSAIYKKIARDKAGIYSNKLTHRYEARKDYFIKEENDRLAQEGKRPRPFRTLMKARFKAFTKYKEGNAAVLEAGYQDIKKSYIQKAKVEYFSDKLQALNDHINWLQNEKNRIWSNNMDQETLNTFNQIERAEQDAITQRDKILNNPNLQDIVKGSSIVSENKGIVQTDAVSLNQHDRANKANVTRTITGVKVLGGATVKYVGPKIQKWMIDNSKISTTETIPSKIENKWVEGTVQSKQVDDFANITKINSKDDLVEAFSIENLMKLNNKGKVSEAYNYTGNIADGTNLDFFRGAAQEIDGRVVSLSDGNGFNYTNITNNIFPKELLNNGVISEKANLFDILAALQKEAGNNVTSQDLINKVLSCGSKEEQVKMIKQMTEGLDFWKSISPEGIATGWSSSNGEILRALDNVNVVTDKIKIGSHLENIRVPGHFENILIPETTKQVLVDNPRIVKALGIGNKIGKGATIMDAISMFFENLRDTKSNTKSNKKEPRQYTPTPKAGFTGKSKKEDKNINNSALEQDIRQEINNLER